MSVRRAAVVVLCAAGALAALAALALWAGREPAGSGSGTRVVAVPTLLGGGDGTFAHATRPAHIVFPADHGPHPRFRSEWWYFTGHLRDATGARYGFQLTFFRFALVDRAPPRASKWATTQAYMAHFGLVDPRAGRFHAAERLDREALGLAGARREPLRVWVHDWSLAGGHALLPARLHAGGDGAAIDLELTPGKPPVLQGENGYSRKGRDPGNASYYYSYTRLPAAGTVTVGGRAIAVEGSAWFDHEWSTSALDPDQVGWDWFAVQLEDGRELMYYRLRRADGSTAPTSAGVLVDRVGGARRLAAGEVAIRARSRWSSAASGAAYPLDWHLAVPSAGLDLDLEPLVRDQEQGRMVRYWEGANRVRGSERGRPIVGDAYVELVGYGAR